MKKFIKGVYYINRGWWDSFTSCFIGTLLGIGITFGITAYLEKKSKAEMERKIQIISIASLQADINSIKSYSEKFAYTDSIFYEVMDYYPDSIKYIPKELVSEFYSELLTVKSYVKNNSADNMFNSNIEVWKSIDNLSTIKIISDIFAAKQKSYEFISELESVKKRIYENISHEEYILGLDNPQKAIGCLFKNKENLNLVLEFALYNKMLSFTLPMLEEMYLKIRYNLNISEKDLDLFFDSRYDIPEDSVKYDI
ncbi:MAG: hypothetical protein SOR57_07040 [Parabacteroides sp.]|nr:hypothetical protein [Parabacteroides sp.]